MNEHLKKSRQKLFVNEYLELRKTTSHSKAIHQIKDKYFFTYITVSKYIPKEIVEHFETTRPMARNTRKKQPLQ